ncbi:MAG TPA: hypothetical protein VHL53_16460 [Acidimicrobiia bacterium]|nr:hypothetical protein [Acidimicrobiia bacterium]
MGARYRSLQQFFKWLVAEEELETSPLAKVARPKVPEIPVPVVSRRPRRPAASAGTG